MKRIGLIGAAALAACHSTPPPETAAFHEPSSAVAFLGWTHERPRAGYPLPPPYLAVANARGDELRLIDLATDKPVMSPGFAFPLSIPTLPRPSYLAASSLRDGGADLLAVAGVGTIVEIVSTWDDGSGGAPGNRVLLTYDLSQVPGVGAGAEILSMIATPVPGVPAGTPPVAPAQPGSAWLIVGFSGSDDQLGGKLVVLEFVRGADGSVVLGAPAQVKNLGFDPVSLAVSPDLFHLYAATPDVITDFTTFPPASGARQVQGVAEVDMSGGVDAPWPVRGLDARAPSMLVAAAILGERVTSDPDQFGAPSPRVYAALDPSGCGSQRPIDCGIAVIDPAVGGLAPDLAPPGNGVPAQPFRAPILVPAVPLTLSIAMPSASGPLQCVEADPCPTQAIKQPLMRLIANGERWTTAVAAVGASNGRTYILDLGRSGPASDVSLLNSNDTRVLVTSAQSLTPLLPDGTLARAGLALYRQYPLDPLQSPGLTADAAKMTEAVMVTPGFTRGDTWTIAWQGTLPGLAERSFVLGLQPDGSLYLAFQSQMGNQWDVAAYVGNPELGIHPADTWPAGDLVQFEPPVDQFGTAGNPCALAAGTKYEAPIASILPPDTSLYPGGALKLVMPSDPASDPFMILCLRDWLVANPPPAGTSLLVGSSGSVRASGLVLSGSASGYAGRPLLLSQADVDAATKRFNLAWQDEGALFGEPLVLARKARRFFYANDPFFPAVNVDNYPEIRDNSGGDPLAAGPALGFIVGPMCSNEPPGSGLAAICPLTRMNDLLRDSALVLTTRSGVVPTSRQPVPLSLPSWAVAVDRSQFPDGGDAGTVFYVTYHQDSVLLAVPGQTLNISSTLR